MGSARLSPHLRWLPAGRSGPGSPPRSSPSTARRRHNVHKAARHDRRLAALHENPVVSAGDAWVRGVCTPESGQEATPQEVVDSHAVSRQTAHEWASHRVAYRSASPELVHRLVSQGSPDSPIVRVVADSLATQEASGSSAAQGSSDSSDVRVLADNPA